MLSCTALGGLATAVTGLSASGAHTAPARVSQVLADGTDGAPAPTTTPTADPTPCSPSSVPAVPCPTPTPTSPGQSPNTWGWG